MTITQECHWDATFAILTRQFKVVSKDGAGRILNVVGAESVIFQHHETITMHCDIPQWPDTKDDFEITVHPMLIEDF